jgi:Uma2 family endonuclease
VASIVRSVEQSIAREPMSLEEFFALDIELIELVDGQPVLLSAGTGPHQTAMFRLGVLLAQALPEGYQVLPSPIDWVLWAGPRATVRQPDIAVVSVDQARAVRLTEPPLLVVEVLSPSSVERDLVAKRRQYAQAGCEHYWIVNPFVPELVALRAEGDEYVEVRRLAAGTVGRLDEPVALSLDPADLLP